MPCANLVSVVAMLMRLARTAHAWLVGLSIIQSGYEPDGRFVPERQPRSSVVQLTYVADAHSSDIIAPNHGTRCFCPVALRCRTHSLGTV
jgi:hypothetical protein